MIQWLLQHCFPLIRRTNLSPCKRLTLQLRNFCERNMKPTFPQRKMLSPQCVNLLRQWDRITREHGLMYRIVQDPKLGELKQLLLPATLKEKVITSLHDDMGHQGLERSLQLIRERCYWPKMYSDVENWIKNCERCTLAKMPNPRI